MRKIIPLLIALITVLPLSLSLFTACRSTEQDQTQSESSDKAAVSVAIPDSEVSQSPDGATRIVYALNNEGAGMIRGEASQQIGAGQATSSVTAVAFVGYEFLQWSDGLQDATRSGDTGEEGTTTTIYAVFTPVALEMPMLFIETETGMDVTSKEEYIGATLSITNCDAEFALNELEMQIRGRGNFSWGLDKKSYRIKLSEKQQLLGVGEGKAKTWTLIANHCDQSLLRNYVAYTLSGMMSGIDYAPSCTNVEVYVNGFYNGVYLLCEPIAVNKHRVNISEDVESGEDIGYLLQMSSYAEEPMFYSGGKSFEIKSDLSSDPATAAAQQTYIQNYINECWSAVYSGDQAQIEALIDLDSVIDTYLVEELVKNLDVGWDSFYVYKDVGGKLFLGPIWDFDLALGNANEGCEEYTDLYVAQNSKSQSNPWYYTLMTYDWFRALVSERWHSDEVQTIVNSLPGLITETAQAGYQSFCRNFECWDIFGQSINRETYYITSLSSYEEHYQYLAQWTTSRIAWLNSFIGGERYNMGYNTESGGQTTPPDRPYQPVEFACSGGSGSQQDPYLISSPEDFYSLTACLRNGQTFTGKYFKQTADLDMTSVQEYAGVGASGSFGGIYDGCGYTIYAKLSGSDECIFPYLTGLVMNLITDGSVSNSAQAAGICRSIRQGGALINCASKMDVRSTGGTAAGLSASTQSGDTPVLFNCFFYGTLEGAETAPTNGWYPGRGGVFGSLYYLDTISASNTAEVDTPLGADAMASELAALLNDQRGAAAEAAAAYGITADDLCVWENAAEAPKLIHP